MSAFFFLERLASWEAATSHFSTVKKIWLDDRKVLLSRLADVAVRMRWYREARWSAKNMAISLAEVGENRIHGPLFYQLCRGPGWLDASMERVSCQGSCQGSSQGLEYIQSLILLLYILRIFWWWDWPISGGEGGRVTTSKVPPCNLSQKFRRKSTYLLTH